MARQGTLHWQEAARTTPPPHSSFPHIFRRPAREAGPPGRSGAPQRALRLPGRLAAVFFVGSGILVLATLPIPVPGLNVTVMAAVGTAAVATGVRAWTVPWEKWSPQASLVLMIPAFALIALTNAWGAGGRQLYGAFFLVAFVWLGMAHLPRTSVVAAPFAALASVLPWISLHGEAGLRLYSIALTIPLCALVGVGTAWAAAKLERAEVALRQERVRTERLRELDEMKDRLLSSVSHELRNPITVCRGHLEVLDDGDGQRELRAFKDTFITELDLMTRLVEDLAPLAHVGDGTRLGLESLSLHRFAARIAKQAETLLGSRLRVDPEVPAAMLRADPQRLSQALLNLLRNAAEHALGTEPVQFRVLADPAGCRFEVTDEGGGLPSGEEEALLEPFRTASPVTGGTGLGLSIVRGIARAHGGEAGVDNRPGRGATFWIRVPR